MRPLLAGLVAFAFLLTSASARAAGPSAEPAVTPRVVAASLSPDWLLKATLYHAGAKGVGSIDSIGCRPVAMRTVATDPRLIPRRTILFIAETVGLPLPGGGSHDGFWYASDVGGAIKGARIDLYTGSGSASMRPIFKLNLKRLSVARAGTFRGCPPTGHVAGHGDLLMQIARRSGVLRPTLLAWDLVAERFQRAQTPPPPR